MLVIKWTSSTIPQPSFGFVSLQYHSVPHSSELLLFVSLQCDVRWKEVVLFDRWRFLVFFVTLPPFGLQHEPRVITSKQSTLFPLNASHHC